MGQKRNLSGARLSVSSSWVSTACGSEALESAKCDHAMGAVRVAERSRSSGSGSRGVQRGWGEAGVKLSDPLHVEAAAV